MLNTHALGGAAGEIIPGSYVVQVAPTVQDVRALATQLVGPLGGSVRGTFKSALKGFAVANLPSAAASALARNPNVVSVEADRVFELAATQWNAPWGLDRIDQAALPLDGGYSYPSLGSGVNVYIIDSGIRRTHVEFGGRVGAGFSAIADSFGPDGCHWHGTHVAGVVGGANYGAAKGATLHSVRAYDCNGVGTTSTIVAAVDWVTSNRTLPAVANLSISGPLSSSVNTAVQNSIRAGVTYVVAAGNNTGADACNYSPASVPEAITVAATEGNDSQSNYSNGGPCVDLYAPGSQIYAATNTSDTQIALYSGTSQSSAFAAGVAAVYLSGNPSATPAQVQQALVNAASVGPVRNVTGGAPNRMLKVVGSGSTTPPPTGNVAPVARFTYSCVKASCTFDGSSSSDDSKVVSYSWSFGDGTSASGAKVAKTYSTRTNITVTVKLTVTDDAGASSSTQQSVSIKVKGK